MSRRIAPLSLVGLTLAAAIDAWLLAGLVNLATDPPPGPERAEWRPKLATATEPPIPAQAIADYRQTLARPLFFKARAPWVPPPPPPPPTQPSRPAPPAPAFVDPGFSVGGIMMTDIVRRAYLTKKPDPHGVWVREGEQFMGWTVQSITANIAKLQQNDRTIELRLYVGQ